MFSGGGMKKRPPRGAREAGLDSSRDIPPPRLLQVALSTSNMSGSLRLFSELFGFANAGGSAAWGDVLAMQQMPADTHCLVWWLVGATPLLQVELFQYGFPEQRPQPDDWRPSDCGWVRMGIAVSDFERVVEGLRRMEIAPIGQSGGDGVGRRLAFREPYAGGIIEVIEQAGVAGPTVVYATSSVADLDAARRFYAEVVGGEIRELGVLHQPEDEALWGLAGARREGFIVDLPGGMLEIVHYSSPKGRPRPVDARTNDLGFINVALGGPKQDEVRALIQRIKAHGVPTTVMVDTELLTGTYVTHPGYELELMNVPAELEAMLGFRPAVPFVSALND